MQTEGRRESDNVEDRRGSASGGKKMAVGGGLGVLIVAVLALLTGGDPSQLLALLGSQITQGGGAAAAGEGAPYQESAAEAELARFTKVVLADTEDVWNQLFREALGKQYQEPKLVLFADQVQSACGFQSAAVGPFYCPGDANVYIDLSFFDELARRHGAAGDFAQAYVIAHEVGHHVQNLLGYSDQVHQQRSRVSETEANRLSVRLELQADFLAGVWAHHTQKQKRVLEPGDLDEALNAAGQIGDDTLQRKAQGRVAPDLFTHGTSKQRIRWFKLGFDTGDVSLRDELFTKPYEQL
ncbi:MAG: neutral zinc metallopeptidase [Planctomycetota bacterium]